MDARQLMIGDWVMVAECVADAHFRDYIIMDIDENGQIGNWKPNEVEEWYNSQLKREE